MVLLTGGGRKREKEKERPDPVLPLALAQTSGPNYPSHTRPRCATTRKGKRGEKPRDNRVRNNYYFCWGEKAGHRARGLVVSSLIIWRDVEERRGQTIRSLPIYNRRCMRVERLSSNVTKFQGKEGKERRRKEDKKSRTTISLFLVFRASRQGAPSTRLLLHPSISRLQKRMEGMKGSKRKGGRNASRLHLFN